MPMEQIITVVVGNGVFAALFMFLLLYLLKDTKEREKKFCDIIKALSSDISKNVQKAVSDIGLILQGIENVKTKLKNVKEAKDSKNCKC